MSQPASPPHDNAIEGVERIERRWATVAVVVVVVFVVVATFAGVHQASLPQARVETADPRTLHLTGEFIESNLGSVLEADGSVTVRAVGQQYSFTPPCIAVPAGVPVTFRVTSADVVHGFLIEQSNINLMLVPGYISVFTARFDAPGERHMPCHEFCGTGHEGMWGQIKIVDKTSFGQMAADHRRLTCVE
jgi:cytochrome c oxidase subunit II